MKYFLIRFNTRLIKRIDLKQGAFISNRQKEEIHESAQMIRRHPADRNTAAHTKPSLSPSMQYAFVSREGLSTEMNWKSLFFFPC